MDDATTYLDALGARARRVLGDELVGVYVGGSFALGGYQPGRSDLDVAVVARRSLTAEEKAAVADALRYEALPCPARGLELVVYSAACAREGTTDAAYELDLNTGRAIPFRLSLAPEHAEAHWYAIDRAILREHGVVILGPPPAEVFATLPREAVLGLLADSIRWHQEDESARADDAVLNACRAWRFATGGVWSSKVDAGEWARARIPDESVVTEALLARRDGPEPERTRVASFLAWTRERLAAEALRA